ncbi:MAG: polyprenyl synthetase family protein [Sporolactobacillus sp.]
MSEPTLSAYMADRKKWFEEHLTKELDQAIIPKKLKESMRYSLTAGGKRLRPILLFAGLETLGEEASKSLSVAIALEMIHTYSLIHDDLPAMDDDDLRRGRPTNHKVYGEATAVLAGDALLTMAFQIISADERLDSEIRIQLITMLAAAAGPEGMVGGQEDDLEAEGKALGLEELMSVHRRKTGRLIRFPIEAAAQIAGATDVQTQALSGYADHIGLAFQIGDDILDIAGNEKDMGKPIGSDLENRKNTYVSLLSMAGARQELERHIGRAIGFLREAHLQDSILVQLAEYLLHRTH